MASTVPPDLETPPPPPPPQLRRRTVAIVVGVVLALMAGTVIWLATRPFEPPPSFRALDLVSGATWNESGTSVGTALRISIDQGGVVALASELQNTSGHDLQVTAIRADPIGIDNSGGAIGPIDPGFFASSPDDRYLTTDEIWAATAELADPGEVTVLEPTGGAGWRPVQPFTWEEGESLLVRYGGPVIGCDSEDISFVPGPGTGAGRKIVIDYSIDGTALSEEIGTYFIDFAPCAADGA